MIDWHRRRHPDDVPTPIAVAVSDFCRRARSPASPAVVRDALALLTEADDFRVRALTDTEPLATPLGPFAVVDIVAGAAQPLASQREATGYYELVQALADERAKKIPVPSAPRAAAAEVAAWAESAGAPPPQTEPPRPPKTKAKTVAEKIAPKKRSPGDGEEARELPEQTPTGSAFLPKRHLPAPRGRFTRLDVQKAPFEELLSAGSKARVDELIDQTQHRVQLRQSLEVSFTGKRGGTLSVNDVDEVIERHRLRPRLEKKEKEVVLGAFREARGSNGRAATNLGMTPQELTTLVDSLSLRREVDEVKARWVREALSPQNLTARFDMLGRSRYLQDLGIEKKFQVALKKDVRKLIDDFRDRGDFAEVLKAISNQHSMNVELLTKTVERLGLSPQPDADGDADQNEEG